VCSSDLYFTNLGAYKAAAHGDAAAVSRWHDRLDHALDGIETQAARLRAQGETEKKTPGRLWLDGEYTDYNREHN
jgi:hydroxylamine dehydrogenase